jgi:putative transposase
MPMLEGEPALALELLNQAIHAWVDQEYHRTVHSEIGATPLARYLAGPNVRRDCPAPTVLADAFRIEVPRCQRRADGTVTLHGQCFEIPARYDHLGVVSLRYARWDRTRVDLIDPHIGAILCPITPLDKSANAERAPAARTDGA